MSYQGSTTDLDSFWDAFVSEDSPRPQPVTTDQHAVVRLHAIGDTHTADDLFIRRLWTTISAPASVDAIVDHGVGTPPLFDNVTSQTPFKLPPSLRVFGRLVEIAAVIALIFVSMVVVSGGDLTPDFDFWSPGGEKKGDVSLVGGGAGRTGQLDTAAIDDASRLIWEIGLDGISPRLVSGNGRLIAGSCQMKLTAVDLKTGELIWDLGALGIFGAPALIGDTVLVGGEEGVFYGLDAENGDERWSFRATGKSVCAPPLVIGNSVYFPDDIGNLYALDAESGEFQWQMALPGPNTQGLQEEIDEPDCICLAVISGDNDRIFAGTESGRVLAIDRLSGTILWITAAQSRPVQGTATDNGTVYVTSSNGPVEAFDTDTGELTWANDDMTILRTRVSVADGVVLVTDSSSRITALDAETGDALWSFAAQYAQFTAQPLIVGEGVYLGTTAPTAVTVLDLQSGEHVAAFGDPNSDTTIAGTTIDDGVIVVASASGVVRAFGSDPSDQ